MGSVDQPDEGLAPIVVTYAGVVHAELPDERARSFVASLQRDTEVALGSLLPQILAEGGQVCLDVPPDFGEADVFVHGLSPALMQAVLAIV